MARNRKHGRSNINNTRIMQRIRHKKIVRNRIVLVLILIFMAINAKGILAYLKSNTEKENIFGLGTYKITFDSNTGTGTMEDQIVYKGITKNLNANTFTKENYHFDGWNTEADGSGTSYADGEGIKPNGDITLYAKWAINTYDVVFNANSGTGTMANQQIAYGTAANLTQNTITREAYFFEGWNTKADGTGESYDDQGTINITSMLENDTLNLYAQWSKADVTLTEEEPYAIISAEKTRVRCGFTATVNESYTITEYGEIYNNNGNINDINMLKYENADGNNIKLGTEAYAARIADNGYGVLAVGFVKVKNSKGQECIVYTGNLGGNFTELAKKTLTYNANGHGTAPANVTMTYADATNAAAALTAEGYTFTGWNTEADGSGTAYAAGAEIKAANTLPSAMTLYAQWEKAPTKYAVQIYGINQDVDASGNTLGLTFGPAVGDKYNNAYVTHEYEETSTGSGEYYVKIIKHTVDENGTETPSEEYLYENGGTTDKVTRTTAEYNARKNINLHDMTWAQIKAVQDKTVFEDCMLCGDTKSVSLTLNSTIARGSVYNQYGDGAGMLYNTVKSTTDAYYRTWNPQQSQNAYVGTGVTLDSNEINYGSNARNAGGYSVSHIRATLIGKNAKTNEGYAGDVNLTSDTCLYSCIESDLQAVITPKKIKYVTGTSTSNYRLNDDIADSIWLFSEREMYGTGQYSGSTTEGLDSSRVTNDTGVGYDKFGNTESKYYISSYNVKNNTNRVAYTEAGSANSWWLRSPYLYYTYFARSVNVSGSIYGLNAYNACGLAFGFCIQ